MSSSSHTGSSAPPPPLLPDDEALPVLVEPVFGLEGATGVTVFVGPVVEVASGMV